MSRKRRSDSEGSRMLLVGASILSCLLMVAAAASMAFMGLAPENAGPSGDQTLAELNATAVDQLRLGRPEAAMPILDAALRDRPNFLPALVNRSWALNLQGRDAEAVKAADKALWVKPGCASALNNKAEALLRQARKSGRADKLKDALACAERSVAADPNCPSSWVTKGNVLAEMGKEHWPKALNAYEQALAKQPSDVLALQALVGKGWLANRKGDYKTALDCHRKATAIEPPRGLRAWSIEAWRIGIYAEMNRDPNSAPIAMIDKAIRLFRDSPGLRDDSRSAELSDDKGLALYRQGKYEKALDELRDATNRNPKSYCAWNNRALALAALGRKDEALAALDTSLREKPGYAAALKNRELILAGKQDHKPKSGGPGPTTRGVDRR